MTKQDTTKSNQNLPSIDGRDNKRNKVNDNKNETKEKGNNENKNNTDQEQRSEHIGLTNNDIESTCTELAQVGDVTFVYPSNDMINLKECTATQHSWEQAVDTDPDNKFILAMGLHPIRSTSSTKPMQYGSTRRGNKESSMTYDRGLYFTDLADASGQCYLLLWEKRARESFDLFLQSNQSIIGAYFIIREPQWKFKYGPDQVPLLNAPNRYSIIPINNTVQIHSSNDVPIQISSELATYKFYKYNQVKIKVSLIEFFYTCDGVYCDRCTESSECFCFEKGNGKGLGMKCTIKFHVHKIEDTSTKETEWQKIENFTSFRFMSLFLNEDFSLDEMQNHRDAFRKHVNEKVEYINNTTKQWNICGWYRQGLKTIDKTTSTSGTTTSVQKETKDVHKAPSQEIILHIASLIPNDINAEEMSSLLWRHNTRSTLRITTINTTIR